MPMFRFSAIDQSGATLDGRMEADDADAVAAALRAGGRWATKIDAERAPATTWGASANKPISDADFALTARELATLLNAGAPLDRALSTIAAIAETARLRDRILDIQHDVRAGLSLADAVEAADPAAPRERIGLIRAGEASGSLPAALLDLADALERGVETRAAMRSALIYPAIVATTAIGAIVFMAVFVLPRFKMVFESAGENLPAQAALAMALSDGLRAYGAVTALGVVVALIFIRVWGRTPRGAVALGQLRLAAPVVGPIVRALDTARFCRTFAMLSVGGAPTLQAASASVEAMANPALRALARSLIDAIGAGASLSEAMRRTGAFAPIAADLARIGEEGGSVAEMLTHVADLLDAKARRSAKQAVDVIAPATTLLLSLIVGGIVASVMTALLSINELV